MSIDIVNLIESNPITKLSGNYNNKLIEKIIVNCDYKFIAPETSEVKIK